MSIVAGIVWWVVFFMTISQKINQKPLTRNSPESFSFKQHFFRVTKITCMLYIILDLLVRHDCLLWMLN
jgi:hypothetical protein